MSVIRNENFGQEHGNGPPVGASQEKMTSAVTSLSTTWPASERSRNSERVGTPHRWVVEIIDREGDGITRLLWRLLGNEADVLDAFQDTFCNLAQRGRSHDLKSTRAYAYRTASNIAIELIRTRKRRGQHWESIAQNQSQRDNERRNSPESEVDPVQHHDLREAIAHLAPHLRSVVVLRDLGCLSYEEVGRILGIEPSTARVYRHHAVVKLGERLQGAPKPC